MVVNSRLVALALAVLDGVALVLLAIGVAEVNLNSSPLQNQT